MVVKESCNIRGGALRGGNKWSRRCRELRNQYGSELHQDRGSPNENEGGRTIFDLLDALLSFASTLAPLGLTPVSLSSSSYSRTLSISRTFPKRSASESTAPPRAVTSPFTSSIVSFRATDTYSIVWMSGSCWWMDA